MKIASITARKILDSRGEWTIAVNVRLANGISSEFAVPQGKSRGRAEAVFVSPEKAIRNIEKIIAPKLRGINVAAQKSIDETLLKLDGMTDKSRLGANAILGVSCAAARAAAAGMGLPLYEYLRRTYDTGNLPLAKPRLYVNVINGGLHAGNNLDFQEYLIIPKTVRWSEAIQQALAVYRGLEGFFKKHSKKESLGVGDEGGFVPNFRNNAEPFTALRKILKKLRLEKKIDFGLDAAASNVKISDEKLLVFYKNLIKKYGLFYLEDPFAENDFKNFAKLNAEIGKKVLITGDDLTTTNANRMLRARAGKSVNAVIIKPNQIGTLSETLQAVRLARQFGWAVIVSHRSGETNDSFIADLAYAVGADGLKLGAPARGERIAKYNRLLEIEEFLRSKD